MGETTDSPWYHMLPNMERRELAEINEVRNKNHNAYQTVSEPKKQV